MESTPFLIFWGIIYYDHFLSGDHFLSNLGIISRPVSSAGLYSPYLTLMCDNYMCNKKAGKWLILKNFGLNVDEIETKVFLCISSARSPAMFDTSFLLLCPLGN